jgi:hypothetical protein
LKEKPVDKSGQARIASGVTLATDASNDARKFMLAMQDGFTSKLSTAAYIFPKTGIFDRRDQEARKRRGIFEIHDAETSNRKKGVWGCC